MRTALSVLPSTVWIVPSWLSLMTMPTWSMSSSDLEPFQEKKTTAPGLAASPQRPCSWNHLAWVGVKASAPIPFTLSWAPIQETNMSHQLALAKSATWPPSRWMPRSAQGEDTNHFWNLVPPPAASSLTPTWETASLSASAADGNARCCCFLTTSATPLSDRASESGFRTGVSAWGRAARAPAEIASTMGEESAGAAANRLIAVAPIAAAAAIPPPSLVLRSLVLRSRRHDLVCRPDTMGYSFASMPLTGLADGLGRGSCPTAHGDAPIHPSGAVGTRYRAMRIQREPPVRRRREETGGKRADRRSAAAVFRSSGLGDLVVHWVGGM